MRENTRREIEATGHAFERAAVGVMTRPRE